MSKKTFYLISKFYIQSLNDTSTPILFQVLPAKLELVTENIVTELSFHKKKNKGGFMKLLSHLSLFTVKSHSRQFVLKMTAFLSSFTSAAAC